MSGPLVIDGSRGEGGGQVVRTAVALAAVTGRPTRVENIRAGRPRPGLAAQHIAAIIAVAALCDAEVSGLSPGSRAIEFRPGALRGRRVEVEVGTAGSATLVLQACLPAALRAPGPCELHIAGGTDVPWSPPADYILHVFLPLLARMGARVEVEVRRRGYAPRGGGLLVARVAPCPSPYPLRLPGEGGLGPIRGIAHAANLPDHVPRRMREAALRALADYPDVEVEARLLGPGEALGPGGALVLWAEARGSLLGSDALARPGVPSERLGREAAEELRRELASGATLDVRAADQLVPYMALAQSPSTFLVREPSGHLVTHLDLVGRFLGVTHRLEPQGPLTRVEVHPPGHGAGAPPGATSYRLRAVPGRGPGRAPGGEVRPRHGADPDPRGPGPGGPLRDRRHRPPRGGLLAFTSGSGQVAAPMAAFAPVILIFALGGILGIAWILLTYLLFLVPLRDGQVERALTPALVVGILTLIFGGLIPGILLIVAYVKAKDAHTKILLAKASGVGARGG